MIALNILRQIATLDRSLVVVIDIQNDFCSPEGAFFKDGAFVEALRQVLPTLSRFLGEVRSVAGKIVFTRHEYQPEALPPAIRHRDRLLYGSDGFPLPGSWGSHFCPPILPLPGEPVIVKHRYSAFSSPAFLDIVEQSRAETLILTGVLSNVCVETTAREAEARGYNLVVLEDCVASNSIELHRATLANIAGYFGWVCTSDELVSSWKPASG